MIAREDSFPIPESPEGSPTPRRPLPPAAGGLAAAAAIEAAAEQEDRLALARLVLSATADVAAADHDVSGGQQVSGSR